MDYRVRLNAFEGPFDLLVFLIENAQMDIYDIQIAEITDQFISYIDEMKQMDINVTSEFMVLAAALIELKSRMLLPGGSAGDDSVVEEDPRRELVSRIIEYKRFKKISEMLKEREEENLNVFEKPGEDLSEYTDNPVEVLETDTDRFISAFRRFLHRKHKLDSIRTGYSGKVVRRITTEEKSAFIASFMKEHAGTAAEFHELLGRDCDRYETAVTFVSMLEMVKENRLTAEQKYIFGDIMLKATEYLFGKEKGSEAEEEQREDNGIEKNN